jgi:hypothetical protein
MSKIQVLLLLAAVAAVAAGGVAVAQGGGAGTINGCVGDRGVLRVVGAASDCTVGESPIAWNQQGPKGETGPPGVSTDVVKLDELQSGDGAPGSKRLTPKEKKVLPKSTLVTPKTSGAAHSVFRDTDVVIPGLTVLEPPVEVAKLILPAGRWVIVAKAMMVGQTAGNVVGCTLVAGVDSDSGSDGPGTFTRTVVHRFKKPGRVLLQCWGSGRVSGVKITGMSFGSLVNKPYP